MVIVQPPPFLIIPRHMYILSNWLSSSNTPASCSESSNPFNLPSKSQRLLSAGNTVIDAVNLSAPNCALQRILERIFYNPVPFALTPYDHESFDNKCYLLGAMVAVRLWTYD